MTIDTKFNIGDEVWLMDNNRAETKVIDGIYIEHAITKDACSGFTTYHIEDSSLHHYFDYQLFRTKQELLDSL